jgi:hypothetical protein
MVTQAWAGEASAEPNAGGPSSAFPRGEGWGSRRDESEPSPRSTSRGRPPSVDRRPTQRRRRDRARPSARGSWSAAGSKQLHPLRRGDAGIHASATRDAGDTESRRGAMVAAGAELRLSPRRLSRPRRRCPFRRPQARSHRQSVGTPSIRHSRWPRQAPRPRVPSRFCRSDGSAAAA